MTTTPEPMPGEDPGVPPDEQEPEVTPLDPSGDPEVVPVASPDEPVSLPE